jgi:acyl-CoA thioester hydrolase
VSQRLRETSVDFEVPFRHVDPMGVVWHGHYYSYMEEARTKLLRSCELDVGDLLGRRYLFFVIESRCRHAHPLFYRDRARTTAWLRDVRRRIHVAYEIRNLTRGRRAARGYTLIATTDAERNLLLETPDEIVRRLLG